MKSHLIGTASNFFQVTGACNRQWSQDCLKISRSTFVNNDVTHMCFASGETHISSDILALGNTRRGATHITVTLQQFLSSRPTRRQEQAKELPHTKDHQGLCFSFDTRRALETEISKWSLVVFVGFAMKPLILEHPSFFLQVRNNGGDSFPNTVNSCGEITEIIAY